MPDYSLVCKNLLSALKEPEVVDSLLEKEVKKGFMIGPFDDPPFPDYRIYPIGIATRKYSGKKRLTLWLCSGQIDPKKILFFPKILVNVIALDSNLLTLFT